MSAYSLQLVNFLSIFDMKFVSDKCIPSFISIYYVSIVIIDENKNLVFFFVMNMLLALIIILNKLAQYNLIINLLLDVH